MPQLPHILEPIPALTPPPKPSRTFRSFTAAEAGAFLGQPTAQTQVVVLWRSQCPACERTLSKLAVMAKTVSIQAFSLDRDPRMAGELLDRYAVMVPRQRILRWEAGELSAGLGVAGIKLNPSFVLPLIAVMGADGRVVGQWEGEGAVDAAWDVLEGE